MRSPRNATQYEVRPVSNPALRVNEVFPAYENLRDPRNQQLRTRYHLDRVVQGETDEFRRLLLLRHWIKRHMRINNAHPTPAREDAFSILDAALKGGGFHCAHFSLVQQAVYTSFGYVTRRLGAGPGLNEPGKWGHHGINEVWVNSLCQWVLLDAKYDFHFEKDRRPLSALEIRDEVLADNVSSLRLAVGPDRRQQRKPPANAGTYRWVSWETTPYFTQFPNRAASALVVYEDEFYRTHTWYRDGAPHWAYAADFFLPVRRRNWIEWTPNVIASRVTLSGARAEIALTSCTPNFLTYEMCRAQGPWKACPDRVSVPLSRSGVTLCFRTVNLAGATGPEHVVDIRALPHGGP